MKYLLLLFLSTRYTGPRSFGVSLILPPQIILPLLCRDFAAILPEADFQESRHNRTVCTVPLLTSTPSS